MKARSRHKIGRAGRLGLFTGAAAGRLLPLEEPLLQELLAGAPACLMAAGLLARQAFRLPMLEGFWPYQGRRERQERGSSLEWRDAMGDLDVKRERAGLFGGSFDPPHKGHIQILKAAKRKLSLDRVYVIPCLQSPLKRSAPKASAFHRLKMSQLAFAPFPFVHVDERELKRDGKSWSFQTAESFSHELPEAELFFIIGSDQLQNWDRWKMGERILEVSSLVAVERPPWGLPQTRQELPLSLRRKAQAGSFADRLPLRGAKPAFFLRMAEGGSPISSSLFRKEGGGKELLAATSLSAAAGQGRPANKPAQPPTNKQRSRQKLLKQQLFQRQQPSGCCANKPAQQPSGCCANKPAQLPDAVQKYISMHKPYHAERDIREACSLAHFCQKILQDKKASHIQIGDGGSGAYLLSLKATGLNPAHSRALCQRLEAKIRDKFLLSPLGKEISARWAAMDYGALAVHIFCGEAHIHFPLWRERPVPAASHSTC